jgi:hypothetical protein
VSGLPASSSTIYWAHVAQHQWRWRYDWEGNRVEDIFDPTDQVARQTTRYGLFHIGLRPGAGRPRHARLRRSNRADRRWPRRVSAAGW